MTKVAYNSVSPKNIRRYVIIGCYPKVGTQGLCVRRYNNKNEHRRAVTGSQPWVEPIGETHGAGGNHHPMEPQSGGGRMNDFRYLVTATRFAQMDGILRGLHPRLCSGHAYGVQ